MAAHKGVGYRTPRTQAMKMGTEAKGFEGGIPYDAMGGVPSSVARGSYNDFADEAKLSIGKNKASIHYTMPFVLK
jgi:hypothetical protein